MTRRTTRSTGERFALTTERAGAAPGADRGAA
jgi:hypothetical protein